MATPPAPHLTERQERNERYLAWLTAIIAEIPSTAQEWSGLPEGERAGFAAEWDNYMGMIETVIADYWAGDLLEAQRETLFALVRRLEQFEPLLGRMNLHGPELHGLGVLLWADTTTVTD